MLLKAFVYERLLRKVSSKGGSNFHTWRCSREEAVSLWKKQMPIPCIDKIGTRYFFYKNNYVLDENEVSRWIKNELPKIHAAAVDAAAKGNDSIKISINTSSDSQGDVSIWMPAQFMKILSDDCGEDCTLYRLNDTTLVMSWDD